MMKVPHLIASMIDFYYRNRNSHKIFKRKVRFNAFCLDEEEKFTYMKNHIVETIKDRKYGYIRDNDLLLTSELGNLQDAIAEAKESYKIVAPIIYQHIREARVDSENDPDVEEHIGAYYDDIENLIDLKNIHIKLFGEHNECSICLEGTIGKTICNHNLCQKCYCKLQTKKCPMCRTLLCDENEIYESVTTQFFIN